VGDVNVWTNRLIGRDRELAALGSLLDEAVVDGATLLLTGEPGVGKTALLVAAAEMATAAGFEVIRGGGVEYETDVSFAGLRRAVVIPGVRNKVIAASGRFMPHEWLTRVSARLLRPASAVPRTPIEVHNEIVAPAAAERVWDLLTDVEGWPSWYRACRWVQVESTGSAAPTDSAARPASFRWKAHPIALRSTVVASDRPYSFAFIADARGLHAEHTFTLRPAPGGLGTIVLSHETQAGPLPRLGRVILGPRLQATTQAWLADLARAVHDGRAAQATPAAG
jgi:AAA ATPase domain/Polyketide cyclase / dehydrase and lipid transport